MKHFLLASLLGIGLVAVAVPQEAQACAALAKVSQVDSYKVPEEDIQKCIELGMDPPLDFRRQGGLELSSTARSTLRVGYCNPDGTCPNSSRERTTNFPPGYGNNPNLGAPEIPWKDLSQAALPCGAVVSAAKDAWMGFWGNVDLNLPPQADTLINSAISGLLGKLFNNKYKECQDGTFWTVLNNLITVVLPQLGIKKPGFVYDITNSTFITIPGTMLALPIKSTLSIDLAGGGGDFTLPVGGVFYDNTGRKYNVPANATVQFSPTGMVTTTAGQNYRVPAGSIVTLDPRGLLALPTGVPVVIPPDATVFPMRPSTARPDWAKPQ